MLIWNCSEKHVVNSVRCLDRLKEREELKWAPLQHFSLLLFTTLSSMKHLAENITNEMF